MMIMLTVLQVIVTANDQNEMNAIYCTCMHLKDDKKSPNRNTETKEKEKWQKVEGGK